ncbi:MAG: alpha/beta fold hydrolase [Nocardioidaceae bacterium]
MTERRGAAPADPGASELPSPRLREWGAPGTSELASLRLHEWGDPAGQPLVCLHGLGGHGARFARLAGELSDRRVLAPDLRGHGGSEWLPPWDTATHVADVLAAAGAAGVERCDWVGYSFGGRVLAALAAAAPEQVARACLLDPALSLPASVCLEHAEAERADESFATVDEAIEAELATGLLLRTPRATLAADTELHLARRADGRLAYRYSRAAAIAAWSEMARTPPPVAPVPTLLVVGERSWIPVDEARLRAALGDRLETRTVPGGHSVLWDAPEETAAAVAAFLADRA